MYVYLFASCVYHSKTSNSLYLKTRYSVKLFLDTIVKNLRKRNKLLVFTQETQISNSLQRRQNFDTRRCVRQKGREITRVWALINDR